MLEEGGGKEITYLPFLNFLAPLPEPNNFLGLIDIVDEYKSEIQCFCIVMTVIVVYVFHAGVP